jgi:hypothetical protein
MRGLTAQQSVPMPAKCSTGHHGTVPKDGVACLGGIARRESASVVFKPMNVNFNGSWQNEYAFAAGIVREGRVVAGRFRSVFGAIDQPD